MSPDLPDPRPLARAARLRWLGLPAGPAPTPPTALVVTLTAPDGTATATTFAPPTGWRADAAWTRPGAGT